MKQNKNSLITFHLLTLSLCRTVDHVIKIGLLYGIVKIIQATTHRLIYLVNYKRSAIYILQLSTISIILLFHPQRTSDCVTNYIVIFLFTLYYYQNREIILLISSKNSEAHIKLFISQFEHPIRVIYFTLQPPGKTTAINAKCSVN